MMNTTNKKILVFLFLTFSLSSIFYFFIASAETKDGYVFGLMLCPGIAAIATQLYFHRSLRRFGWRPGKVKFIWMGYGLPVVYGLVLYGVVWLTGLGKFIPAEMAEWLAVQWGIENANPYLIVALYLLAQSTLGVVFSCATALGEEIGWRGLLVPELAKVNSFFKTALISGGIWAVWHYPVMLFADYGNTGTPIWFNLIFFTLAAVGISFPLAWLRLKSGSIWPAVILHASHNLFFQVIFSPLTGDTGITEYLIGEFGIGLALISLLVAWLFWRKRDELSTQEQPGSHAI
jgi:uncharacterized protein